VILLGRMKSLEGLSLRDSSWNLAVGKLEPANWVGSIVAGLADRVLGILNSRLAQMVS
jgi:hypothetical protein